MIDEPIVLPPPPAATTPWTLLWGGVLALRRRRWRTRARRLPAPVVSIGNLALGGTGKTPLVAAIAAHLRDRGHRVAILSRGYDRQTRGVHIASRGEGPEGSAAEVGDEPYLLAQELPGVAVVVGEDRYQAGLHALEELSPRPGIFLLDDGFSHLGLARDLDLLAFPQARPWGNGRLLPFGTLREPLTATRAAHAVLLTGLAGAGGNPGLPAGAAQPLAAALRAYGFTGPAFAAGLDAEVRPKPSSPRVVLATGVAHPERVVETARSLGLTVAEHLAFADHHRFPQRSLERIEHAHARSGGAAVVVTAKDHAKIEGRLRAPLHVLRIAAVLEPAFWSWLDRELEALSTG
jgi:tetraacyldisaccharide 4'-kinase